LADKYSGYANFRNAEFQGYADFNGAAFRGIAFFDNAKFFDDAIFNNSWFQTDEDKLTLDRASCYGRFHNKGTYDRCFLYDYRLMMAFYFTWLYL
jgi:hypothetical protein